MTPDRWATLRWYRPDDFKHPEKLDYRLLRDFDWLASALNRKATVLSDWRMGDRGQHPEGRAIDFVYPDLDSTFILDTIRDLKRFTGYGMYVNNIGAISFHVDNRIDRTPNDPATWGGVKSGDETSWTYVALKSVVDLVTPSISQAGILIAAALLVFLLWPRIGK